MGLLQVRMQLNFDSNHFIAVPLRVSSLYLCLTLNWRLHACKFFCIYFWKSITTQNLASLGVSLSSQVKNEHIASVPLCNRGRQTAWTKKGWKSFSQNVQDSWKWILKFSSWVSKVTLLMLFDLVFLTLSTMPTNAVK